ncbi:TRAP dicarboxylate transporter [Brucella pinnipedialis M163/99/10]|nr:TRAP dicarboxylate transporter [Brucella pinnipedialis M163/99/10]
MKETLSRRSFLTKGAAIGAAAATSGAALATPAIAAELPTLRWRLTFGLSEQSGHHLWRRGLYGRCRFQNDGRQVPDSGVPGG